LDGDFQRGQIAVDAAVLQLGLLVNAPRALPRNPEAGMIEHEQHFAARLEMLGGVFDRILSRIHVLERQNEARDVEVFFLDGQWLGGIGLDEMLSFRNVEACVLNALRQMLLQHAVAATDVEQRRLGIQF